jgi:hypothetical protein
MASPLCARKNAAENASTEGSHTVDGTRAARLRNGLLCLVLRTDTGTIGTKREHFFTCHGIHMRRKRPRIARLDQVRISRDGEDAIIEFRDSEVATTRLRIGRQVHEMSDAETLLVFNQAIAGQIRNRDELGEYVAVEVPVGNPQVKYNAGTVNEWSPKGGVLRCCIEDGGGKDGLLPTIYVDDQEFSWDDFGKMLCTYAGWGMRIVFVPDDELEIAPKVVVREPDD